MTGTTATSPRTVVVGIGGGIAAYKACHLVRAFTEAGDVVHAVPTESALRFVGAATWEALSGNPVATDVFSDVPAVRHVALGQAADLLVVAPATADLVARLATGRADDQLTTTALVATCPVLVAPAMHTEMWRHPATQDNVATLRRRGVIVLEPADGRLTGADSGPGRLPDSEEIAAWARLLLERPDPAPRDLAGCRVLVSAGGTREAVDPVRFLSNHSSGLQGAALASVAAQRGADVTLLLGAHDLPYHPAGVDIVPVESARDMEREALDRAPSQDVIIMAAAVADFRPVEVASSKLKKGSSAEPEVIRLERTVDVLAELVHSVGARSGRAPGGRPIVVGFAAETGDEHHSVLEHGQDKLRRKGCDLLMVNEVGRGKTFGEVTNEGWLLSRDHDAGSEAGDGGTPDEVSEDSENSTESGDGVTVALPSGSKLAVAVDILDAVVRLRTQRVDPRGESWQAGV